MATKRTTVKKSTAARKRASSSRSVRRSGSSGQYVARVAPPPRQLDLYTRWWQGVFFVPFLLIEFWFAWSLVLEVFTNCSYKEAYLSPYWCEPTGKLYIILMLAMVTALLGLGLFAARIAIRQGIRWNFLLLYTGLVLIGQYIVWRAIVWVLF